ncbi:hypothetical protein BDIM_15460 [Brevundimonas diminuta ATCC 11568]|nr:hypothetical protein BDIM_15460 [Brevundimonas diminuta ATCC 11568]
MSLIAVSIGLAASKPTEASLPGFSRSSGPIVPPPAVRPRPAKLRKTISPSCWKLPRMKAKIPT